MRMPQGLVIGGTGMLAGTVRGFSARGWDLVVPSRRRPRFATDGENVRWVRGEWDFPAELAAAVAREATAPFGLLVAWVHTPHRDGVLKAVQPLLAPDAPVIEVWSSASQDPLATLPPAVLDHPTHRVVLGYQRSGRSARWLTTTEISEGVLAAALAALAGAPPAVREVGVLRPWPPGR
ncbi:hypothetical protein F4561_001291 [Lipingzhangella halophila]|uniref:Pyrroline-5-carboxylate reductase catalytic N-terminal domain-containing protein n=1 Tax=Lipingzhangella halophila TaxID=1783352 RepID=A0A7W7REH4_9ACTN|nr:hypothetical protein [Lipingzhangella halophila]MBB4930471.1 hypothetical protein [Lipingzhangella halophila]